MSFFIIFVLGFVVFFILKLFFSAKSAKKGRNSKYIRSEADYTTPRDQYGNFYDPYTGQKHKRKSMDADHIFPYSKGGTNADWNVIYTHKSINRSKGNKISASHMAKGFYHNKKMRKSIKDATKFGVGAGIGDVIIDHLNNNLS